MDNITRRDNGLAYIADEKCVAQIMENRRKIYEYNNTAPWEYEKINSLLKSILGKAGKNTCVCQPFRCDYGFNIEVGDNFFANYNLIILDTAKVTIGNNVFLAPNVAIYAAGHPVHYASRNSLYEYGAAISIGDNCWIGGNTVICPGVNIGNGVVIGAGSVVTRDIPDNVIAAGNPCKIIREITDEDKKYYFKKNEFDSEAMEYINNCEAME